MKAWVSTIFLFLFCPLQAEMTHRYGVQELWTEKTIAPFDELIMTWNGSCPSSGKFSFFVSLKVDESWSPWLLYAVWEESSQASFDSKSLCQFVRTYQDTVEVLNGKKASSFRVRVVPEAGTSLNCLQALHVYTNGDKIEGVTPVLCDRAVVLDIRGESQMQLAHPRFADLCSPTSTASVVKYLLQDYTIDTKEFAETVLDYGFDIYGNWVFNASRASTKLGPRWSVWVERLKGFDGIVKHLFKGVPVVVSVKGPLAKSALPYAKGHLLVVTGYDPVKQVVFCMDPAFPTDDKTTVSYALSDFLQGWERRGKVAYIFKRN